MNQKDYRIGKFAKLADAEKCVEASNKKGYYQNIRIVEL